jgi:hypothetical protein
MKYRHVRGIPENLPSSWFVINNEPWMENKGKFSDVYNNGKKKFILFLLAFLVMAKKQQL